MNKTYRFKLLFFGFLFFFILEKSWAIENNFDNIEDPLHAYIHTGYQFYHNDFSIYDILFNTQIPLNIKNFNFEISLTYLLQKRLNYYNQYNWSSQWYGDFISVYLSYLFSHQLDGLDGNANLHQHNFNLGLGFYFNNWELYFSEMLSRQASFEALSKLKISYLFGDEPINRQAGILITQTSYKTFTINNFFKFAIDELWLSFSWQVFPIELNFGIRYAINQNLKVSSSTNYYPALGFSNLFLLGFLNHHQRYYLNSKNRLEID